jgi:Fe2+ transport system protein FeoA
MFGGNKPKLVDSETTRLPALPISRPLTDLAVRTHGTVVEVPEGKLLQRCMEMGLLPGAHITVIQGGDPMLLSIDGSRTAISRAYVKGVLVI